MPGLALVILHIVLARRWSLWASLGVTLLVLAIGLYGRGRGRSLTDEAIASLSEISDAETAEMVREEGYKEASRPIQFAGIVCAVFGVGIAIGELRRRRA